MKTLILTFCLIFPSLVWAGGSSTVGPGNPSAKSCELMGGNWFILEDEGKNQWGFCSFDSGIVDSWTLYRHCGSGPQQATQAYLNRPARFPDMPDKEAEGYCVSVGGTVKKWNGSLGYPTDVPITLCQFSDRSIIGAWTLYYGPNYAHNQLFTQKLNSCR